MGAFQDLRFFPSQVEHCGSFSSVLGETSNSSVLDSTEATPSSAFCQIRNCFSKSLAAHIANARNVEGKFTMIEFIPLKKSRNTGEKANSCYRLISLM